MKVLFLSNLYPNSQEPTRAVFNRQKTAHLNNLCEITVVAPIQWFPFKSIFARQIRSIPRKEIIGRLDVYHPRVFYVPRLFRFAHGAFYYLSVRSFIKNLRKKFDFDIIFVSWVYPDGFAAMKLSKLTGKPFVVLAHGSDINIQLKTFWRRRVIAKTLQKANNVIAVSKGLKERMVKLGIEEEKILVIYDGVDHNLFYPMGRDLARKQLGLVHKGAIILFVGNIVKIKGIEFLLQAVDLLGRSDWKLYIIGNGDLENSLKKTISGLGLEDRVTMVGTCAHNQIPLWMNASDVLCLPSMAEGLPDVIIEALVCGIPVVASRVGGIPELITDDRLGLLIEPRDVKALSDGINRALNTDWDRNYIAESLSAFSWEDTASKLFECLKSCAE